ncbi:hypothetical protein GCM10011352_26690 [Marinobacterium zhoushanense]|uniref:DUF3829 domain-containing protein n=1 Tax=Marinobacterium zhoushanense TaxID=1679163 RepID=A0ABQ1KG63_9GAMM|nr:hypothetical protein [Marinobacterium zhoushanense]GGB99176.1 hypothetical protein GCM10011352_26690 [Marinobacterium zhoushanense]
MHAKLGVWALLLTLTLTGCANLKEVREYAGESAKFSAYTELTERFRDTYYREQPYLTGEAERLAQVNDIKRKAAYDDLLTIHQRVALYMQTLARLSGEDTFDLSGNLDSLAGGIKEHPDLGIDKQQVDAIADLANVVTRWATASQQQRAVREMIKAGDAPLQTTLQGMKRLVRYYRASHENEKRTVLGFFEVELPYVEDPEHRLLATLARAHLQAKEAEYQAVQPQYEAAAQGIERIAEGHRKLLENIDDLTSQAVRDSIKRFAKDIKAIRKDIQSIEG